MDREIRSLRPRRHKGRRRPISWETVWQLVAALAMLAPTFASACSPIKVAYVYFDRNSAAVSAAQVSSVANWIADLRVRYPNHGSITLHASTEPGEHSPDGLGMERAHNIARVLRNNLGLEEAKVRLPERDYVVAPSSATNLRGEKPPGVLGVDIEFLPACPHECPRQSDDPLYKAPAPR